tara:strand:- start:423 stop:713 length:291 start_codon:yes stop_codon:yes gene_type:complete
MNIYFNDNNKIEIDIFDIETLEDSDKFLYFYLALPKQVKKKFENCYYQAFCKKLLQKSQPKIIHTDVNNVTHIEVHPEDILKNIRIIKQCIENEKN